MTHCEAFQKIVIINKIIMPFIKKIIFLNYLIRKNNLNIINKYIYFIYLLDKSICLLIQYKLYILS